MSEKRQATCALCYETVTYDDGDPSMGCEEHMKHCDGNPIRSELADLAKERDAARARLRLLAEGLRELSPGPHGGPMNAEEYVELIGGRIAELEKGPGVRFSPTPGGDDGDFVCAHCGLNVEDEERGHSWEVCARGLFEDRNRSVDAMCDDFAKAMTRTEELEARVKALTEWRPVEASRMANNTLRKANGEAVLMLRASRDAEGSIYVVARGGLGRVIVFPALMGLVGVREKWEPGSEEKATAFAEAYLREGR